MYETFRGGILSVEKIPGRKKVGGGEYSWWGMFLEGNNRGRTFWEEFSGGEYSSHRNKGNNKIPEVILWVTKTVSPIQTVSVTNFFIFFIVTGVAIYIYMYIYTCLCACKILYISVVFHGMIHIHTAPTYIWVGKIPPWGNTMTSLNDYHYVYWMYIKVIQWPYSIMFVTTPLISSSNLHSHTT